MITNALLDRLAEIEVVRSTMKSQSMLARNYRGQFGDVFLLYKLPYVIEIRDVLVENYLEMNLLNLNENRMIHGGFAIDCCLKLGFQSILELKGRRFEDHPYLDVFLSYKVEKMRNLETEIEAFDMLLPIIKVKGLCSMDDGSFSPALSAGIHTSPLPAKLIKEYLEILSGS